jgi:hypothetical protein
MRAKSKLPSLCLLFLILIDQGSLASADDNTSPAAKVSFVANPATIDLGDTNQSVKFTLKVSHPVGIKSEKTIVTIYNNNGFTYEVSLSKLATQVKSEKNLTTFEGLFQLPNDIPPGVYFFYAGSLTSYISGDLKNSITGNKYYPDKIRDLPSAEDALLITLNGRLNFDFQTFVGPSYTSNVYATDSNPRKVSLIEPIWRVGEVFDPLQYFELRTNRVDLAIKSSTPKICSSDSANKKLILSSQGHCVFTVYTPATNEYVYKELVLTATIGAPRIMPSIILDKIPNQTSANLPKSISRTAIYTNNGKLVIPRSITPGVCSAYIDSIYIKSGGRCDISYQSPGDETSLPSEVYIQSIEITRDPQTISFTPPATADLSTKTLTLSAIASGGGEISYQTSSTGTCSITGFTLNLLKSGNCSVTATQAGTSTLAPASATATTTIVGVAQSTKKTITCIKGKTTKKVTGTNPKCPAGYKLKK